MSAARTATPEERSFVDAIARRVLFLLILGQAARGYADSDIWGHTAIGLDMLRSRGLLRVDPYSFTHDQPWINHEWLWDLVTAWTFNTSGLTGVVVVRALLIAVVLWHVSRATRSAPGWARLLTLCIVAIACVGQWRSTRPQIATLAMYAVLLCNLEAWWQPLLFAGWANLHGGWIFGLGAVATHALMRPSRRTVWLTMASAAATLVNPYGYRLWFAILDATQRGWTDITEWQPAWRVSAGADALIIWLAVAGATFILWRHVAREPWRWTWTLVALGLAANSRRLIGLAAVTSALLLMPRWQQPMVVEETATMPSALRWMNGGLVALAAIAAVFMMRPAASCFPPLPGWRAPESDSVAFLRTSGATHVVPHFDYGEYAIFHLRDRLKVAMDNRRETVYSEAAIAANDRFASGLDPDYPDRIGADAVWWPVSGRRVLDGLASRGWVTRFEGPRTAILMKTPGPVVHGTATIGSPCFPEP
jgi:hypothetical protein